MSIIVFDTETTGLLAPGAAALEHQPYLVEFFGIKLNEVLEVVGPYTFRCKPPIPIPEDAIRIHGITNNDVAECKPFAAHFNSLAHFFTGSEIVVGHNALFDKMVLHWELVRIGMDKSFPWAMQTICTAEISSQQKGYRQNLTDLHTELFGSAFEKSHSASADCEATTKCFLEMVEREMIKL